MATKILAIFLLSISYNVYGYPYYYLNQFNGEHFQEHPQPPAYPQQYQAYPQQYQAQPWNQFQDYRLHPQYPQFQQPHVEYPPLSYVDKFQLPQQINQGYENAQFVPHYDFVPGSQYETHYDPPPPQIEDLPQHQFQYDSLPQYYNQARNDPRYPSYQYPQSYDSLPYLQNAPVQYPQYPMGQDRIPEVGSSYARSGTWTGPVKYYIDDKGRLSPPLDPMGNIIHSGQPGAIPQFDTAGTGWAGINYNSNYNYNKVGWPATNTNVNLGDNHIDNSNSNVGSAADINYIVDDHERDLVETKTEAPHHVEEKITTVYADECDQLSCYANCRISLQGGGGCSNNLCRCYPKDGIRRPEDNIWFELSESDQKRILDVEERFEAVPAVMTTKMLDNIPSYTVPAKTTIFKESIMTSKPTDGVEDVNVVDESTPDDSLIIDETTKEDIVIIDAESGEVTIDDYDDSTAWDDGSGAIDDEDSESESWFW